jgi:hypothetical protein
VTHSSIFVPLAVVNLEVILPPEILVVHRVVPVEEDQMLGQRFHVFEFGGVNEGMLRRQFFVVVLKAENDSQNRSPHIFKKPEIQRINRKTLNCCAIKLLN